MDFKTITIKEYLERKSISFRETNGELLTRCLFNKCDEDSKGKEAHLYFSIDTSQYDCKKCGEKGNIVTLAKHLGDTVHDVALENRVTPFKKTEQKSNYRRLDHNLIEKHNREMPERIKDYLHKRGITDELINEHLIGYGNFYNNSWICIPIKDEKDKYTFFKLRRDPADEEANPNKGKSYPVGSETQLYGWDTLQQAKDYVVICEGEFDRLVLLSHGIPAVTSTNGAGTFKEEWVQHFRHLNKVYVCYDNDDPGRKGAERVLEMFAQEAQRGLKVFKITLPEEVGEHGDITDYFVNLKQNSNDLFEKYATEFPKKKLIDTSNFKPLSVEELINILGLTIKQDEANKVLTFFAQLSAYTESSQLNISYNAPSSTGKSYIPMEISSLFPPEDLISVAYCSPTAFFHENGKYNAERNEYLVDLSRKILIFLDQPHDQLLAHLRPLLSHDQKEMKIKITDKNQRGGNRTKTVILRGFPAVVFCTAGLRVDEQEATRFLLLSPETSQEKIRHGLSLAIKKETDYQAFKEWLKSNPEREQLKERIEAIKQVGIEEIKLSFSDQLETKFFAEHLILKPRHQRDIRKIIFIAKSFALLNLWWRNGSETTITANEDDFFAAYKVWDMISESQELNLPPYIYQVYKEVMIPLWKEKNGLDTAADKELNDLMGLPRKDITRQYMKVYGRPLQEIQLRQQILPMIENVGLILQEEDKDDKRKKLVYLTMGLKEGERNSVEGGGVKSEDTPSEADLFNNY